MAEKKFTQLVAADIPLLGDEIIALVQDGVSKQAPVSALGFGEIASKTILGNSTGAPAAVQQISMGTGMTLTDDGNLEADMPRQDVIPTATATIELNFQGQRSLTFVVGENIIGATEFEISNDTNAVYFELIIVVITSSPMTFPSNFLMSDVRWDAGSKEWSPGEDQGTYKGRGTRLGSNWLFDMSQSIYV